MAGDTATDTQPGAVGQPCTPQGMACPGGLYCYTPKTMGGPKPMGTCVPPLQPFDCYDNSPCGDGYCVGSALYQGQPGQCLPKVLPGQCWPELSYLCYADSTCSGGLVCPKNGACPQMSKPGKCTAGPSSTGKVYLWVPTGSLMIPGSKTAPTWVNSSKDTIFLSECTTWETEQKDAKGGWKNLGPQGACVGEGVAKEVPPGGYASDIAWTAPQVNGTVAMGNYRFSSTYSLGCTVGQPISTGKCSSSTEIKSSEVFVGYPP